MKNACQKFCPASNIYAARDCHIFRVDPPHNPGFRSRPIHPIMGKKVYRRRCSGGLIIWHGLVLIDRYETIGLLEGHEESGSGFQ
jgi:hypothetical protein